MVRPGSVPSGTSAGSSRFSTRRHTLSSAVSASLRGATGSVWASSGSGNAVRSTLPFGISGRAASTISFDGTM